MQNIIQVAIGQTIQRTAFSPLLMWLSLVCIAALLVPLHHKVEKWTVAKVMGKNNKIRLAKAKKTIEKLEQNG